MNNELIEPNQWVYVVEKGNSEVKVGVTTDLEHRLKVMERLGGFHILRKKIFGPFQNGYQVETKIHKSLSSYKSIGEWFSIEYEKAISVAQEIVDCFGDKSAITAKKESDFKDLLDWLIPLPKEAIEFKKFLQDESFTIFKDDKGTIWLEHDDYGLFSAQFLDAFIKSEVYKRGKI